MAVGGATPELAALDEAVAEAYGWGGDWRSGVLTDDEILARLFRLNQERAAETLKLQGRRSDETRHVAL